MKARPWDERPFFQDPRSLHLERLRSVSAAYVWAKFGPPRTGLGAGVAIAAGPQVKGGSE